MLTLWIVLTGALHMDGFLDTCDGLLGGSNSVKRMEIMRDERVGAYALSGGALLLLIKFSTLAIDRREVRSADSSACTWALGNGTGADFVPLRPKRGTGARDEKPRRLAAGCDRFDHWIGGHRCIGNLASRSADINRFSCSLFFRNLVDSFCPSTPSWINRRYLRRSERDRRDRCPDGFCSLLRRCRLLSYFQVEAMHTTGAMRRKN